MVAEFTKAYQFTWEAWKFTWKNLKVGLLFILLPCFINIFCVQYFSINHSNNPIMYFALTDLLLPLWLVGWLRYIFTQKLPSLKSYFMFDKIYLMVLLYSFLVSMPLYFYEYLNHLVSFNPLKNIMEVKIGIPLQMDQVFLKHYGVGLISLMLLSLIFLPLYFIFPALVDRKPFLLLKSWERVKPFYLSYYLSYGIFIFVFSFLAIFIWGLNYLITWYLISIGNIYHLEFITSWSIWSFLSNREVLGVVWHYFVSLYFFVLIALYYKKYLITKSKARPKKTVAEAGGSSEQVPVTTLQV